MPDASASEEFAMKKSSRDPEDLRARLEAWLRETLPGADASVPSIASSASNGLSSETVLFTATWTEDGERAEHELVARIAPDPGDVPVFPRYDLTTQFEAVRLVGEHSDVPVPRVWWDEPDPAPVGAPFFVMSRVEGVVPPDVMPYNFGDNWLYDASREDQARLQQGAVDILAGLGAIERPADRFAFLQFDAPGATPMARHLAHTKAWYDFAVADGYRSPLVERGFAWLEEHLPLDEPEAVVSWGDARIGNVLWRDFRPVAVLDWEMAALGPREVDLGWLIYAHEIFEGLASSMGLGGMPHFLRRDDVASAYEATAGQPPRHLDAFVTYAAVQWAIVFLRTGARQIHFGEVERPDDVEALIHSRDQLAERLSRPPSD
jgi:aminoglycoside phosphotransferase (APT) family kinase protein